VNAERMLHTGSSQLADRLGAYYYPQVWPPAVKGEVDAIRDGLALQRIFTNVLRTKFSLINRCYGWVHIATST